MNKNTPRTDITTLPATSQTHLNNDDILSLARITDIPSEDIEALVESQGIEAAEKLLPAQPFNPPYLPETRWSLMTDNEPDEADLP